MSSQSSYGQITKPDAIASVQCVTKSFAGKCALDNIDLQIKSNQVLAILGANGAGKTTLINILLGRLTADSGQIRLFNEHAGSIEAKRQTGALLQVANLPETLKIKEHIQLFQSYYPNPMDYQKIIKYAGLEALQNRYSKKLSGGEKQRLLFALSICGNPKLLFLDEPTVGMDVEARQGLWNAIRDLKAQGTAVVLTTHYLQEADSLADEIVLLKEGKIIKQGSSEEIKASVSHTSIRFNSSKKELDLTCIPNVVSANTSGKFTSLQTDNANQTLLALLTKYPDLEDLNVTNAGLEDAFLQLNESAENEGAIQ